MLSAVKEILKYNINHMWVQKKSLNDLQENLYFSFFFNIFICQNTMHYNSPYKFKNSFKRSNLQRILLWKW